MALRSGGSAHAQPWLLRTLRAFQCGSARLRLLKGNIAEWQGDCVVNAANMQLAPSTLPDYWRHIGRKDVNSALHARAGPGLAEECAALPGSSSSLASADMVASAPGSDDCVRCPRGEARLTAGHLLGVNYVIHAVGPDYDTSVRCAGDDGAMATAHVEAEKLLAATYGSIFSLANEVSAVSIGIPAISCGVMGFGGYDSVNAAARVSLSSSVQCVGDSLQQVDFVLYEDSTIEAWEGAAEDHPALLPIE